MGTKRKRYKAGGKKKQRRAAPELSPPDNIQVTAAHSNAPFAAVKAPTKSKRGRKPLPKSTSAADESSSDNPVASITPEIIATTTSTSPPFRLRDEEDDEDHFFSDGDSTATNLDDSVCPSDLEDDVEPLSSHAPTEAAPTLRRLRKGTQPLDEPSIMANSEIPTARCTRSKTAAAASAEASHVSDAESSIPASPSSSQQRRTYVTRPNFLPADVVKFRARTSAAPSLAELKELFENFTPRWAIALEKKLEKLDVFSNRIAAVEQAVLKISLPPSS